MVGPLIFLLIGSVLQGCNSFQVNLAQTVHVMTGSCVTIPCSFDVMKEHQKNLNNQCVAKWFSSKPKAQQLIDRDPVTGNLTKKDCTTTFNKMQTNDTETYYFRLECNNSLKYSFKNSKVKIEVTDNFPSPTLTPSTLKIKEGESVSLMCSAPAPCLPHPPTLTWTPTLGEIQETLQENRNKTKFKTSVLNFTASLLHNKQNISCTAVYKKQDGSSDAAFTTGLMTDVLYSPKNLTVSASPSGSVLENSNVVLTCNSNANPAEQNYTWYRADEGQENVLGTGKILNIKVSTDKKIFFCKAVNEIGEGHSELRHIDVWFPSQILFSSNCTKTANQLNCSCETVGNPTPMTHWFLNGQPVSPSSQVVVTNEFLDASHLRSIITVNEPQNKDLSTLLCFSSNSLGSASKQFFVSGLETSKENPGQITLAGFIATVVAFVLVVFALLVLIWFQKTHSKPRGIGGDIDTNAYLMTEESQVPNMIEDAIYANTAELSQAEICQPSNGTDNEISESSGKKSEDLVYARVNWSRKMKAKKPENDANMKLTGNSFSEEEKFERGDMLFVSSALEMGSLYAEVKTRNVKVNMLSLNS
ncbi:B-cell receptor CD22-like [Xiphophorus hellerii]|uniref:B-cell receptor CD22-like n=1 Tax=Xiphophorus hellerii TaxID=8084 RepID=UPI0013B44C51|nr:B-cell receptor CD22-like [Xiphophorus hellerii]